LRQYRFGDDDSLGVADLSNAHVHSPHSNNNVIPCRLASQAKDTGLQGVLTQPQVLESVGMLI
jgi:hypothetical protein